MVQKSRYDTILSAMRKAGTANASQLSSTLKMKYDTVREYLKKMVDDGLLYTEKIGNATYYVLMPNGNEKRVRPDIKKIGKSGNARPTRTVEVCPPSIRRATSSLEILKDKGFVCHPTINGNQLDRDFIRCHYNGEYQVQIVALGDLKDRSYIADLHVSITWRKSGLSTNVGCYGDVYLNDDPKPFSLRMVSTKDEKFETLCIKVHPRYIYHVGVDESAQEEFKQQVRDVLAILRIQGWEFGDNIVCKGQEHYAFNDSVLGGLVGEYKHVEGDPLTYDHSHGVNECEVERNDPETIEIMVNLPTIIKNTTESILEIRTQIELLAESVGKIATMQSQILANNYSPVIDNSMIMYG